MADSKPKRKHLNALARTFLIKRFPRCAESLKSVTPKFTVEQITGKTTRSFFYLFEGNKIEVAILDSSVETDMTPKHRKKYGAGRGIIVYDGYHVLFMFGNEKYAVFAFQDSRPR